MKRLLKLGTTIHIFKSDPDHLPTPTTELFGFGKIRAVAIVFYFTSNLSNLYGYTVTGFFFNISILPTKDPKIVK